MSRSLGDGLAKTCGVIATPEVCKDKIDASAKFLFLASDGVWEVLSSQEVSNMVEKFLTSKNPSDAVKAITSEATKRWTTVFLSEAPELYGRHNSHRDILLKPRR